MLQFVYFIGAVLFILAVTETANKYFEPIIWPQFKRLCNFCREQSAR